MFHELVSRDHEDGRATGGYWRRGAPEWYVRGADALGRTEGPLYYSRPLRSLP